MRIFVISVLQLLILPFGLPAQQSTVSPPELGKWWKNSEVVRELQLSQAQVGQIEQSFLDHRRELADLNAELRRREARLNELMQADSLDESAVTAQTELVAAGRMALERANSSMLLSIRKVLSKEQWKKLEEMQILRKTSKNLAAPTFRAAKPRAKSASRTERVYTIADGIKPPQVVYQPLPSYTPQAKEARVEGIVLLQAIIHKDGSVSDFKVLRGLGYGMEESAINTITKEWQFQPGTLDGRPVDVRANIEISFRLY